MRTYPDPPLRRWSRRSLTYSLLVVGFVLMVGGLPIWLPVCVAVDLFRRVAWSTTRATCFVFLYIVFQLYGLFMSFFIWLGSLVLPGRRPERIVDWMFWLQTTWAKWLGAAGMRLFGMKAKVQLDYEFGTRPVILFCRHASITDTFIPLLYVQAPYGIRLHYVMKRELEWDPCLDVAVNRMPHLFVVRGSSDSGREVEAIGRMMDRVGEGEGVTIFPEGTRFTPKKRERVLNKLEESGQEEALKWARTYCHVLPPRTGGPLELLKHTENADVVFCAHTGLEKSSTFRECFNGSLVGAEVHIRLWGVPYDEIPRDDAGRRSWLYEQWKRVDDFIEAHATAETPGADAAA